MGTIYSTGKGGFFFSHFYDFFDISEIRKEPLSKQECIDAGMPKTVFDNYINYIERLYGCAYIDYVKEMSVTYASRSYDSSGIDRSLLEEFTSFCIQNKLYREYKNKDGLRVPVFSPHFFDSFPFIIRYPECPEAIKLATVDDFRLQIEYELADMYDDWYLQTAYYSSIIDIQGQEKLYHFSEIEQDTVPMDKDSIKELLLKLQQDCTDLQKALQENMTHPPKMRINATLTEKFSLIEEQNKWLTERISIERKLSVTEECLDRVLFVLDTDFETSMRSDPEDNTLYIYKGNILCEQNRHNIEQATAILKGINGQEIQMNVNHCLECHRFFMSYGVFQRYKEKYGIILGNLHFVNKNSPTECNCTEWAEESPLHLCGYSVSQAAGLAPIDRQTIIASCIENGAMTKESVIRLLQRFIDVNGSILRNQLAVHKWCEDLDFVLAYNTEKQKQYSISKIVKYTRNKYLK